MSQSNTQSSLERFFHLKELNTDVKTEVLAGITTFVAMAYILFVNPQMLASPFYIMGQDAYAENIPKFV